MIEIHNVNFEYPGLLALDNVSFTVERGDITALVGPNGAGKTTLLRCIAALDTPISGTIKVNGVNVLKYPRETHQQIGYLADFYGLYNQLSVEQALRYAAMSHSIAPENVLRASQHAAQRLGIADRLQQKVSTLSRGLTQRLAIAQAIVHEPKLLLLDEPASGLDPEARRSLSELFLTLQSQGMTLMVSSHILAELEEYSTSMLIIRDGKIIEHQQLKHRGAQSLLIRVSTTRDSTELASILAQQPLVEILKTEPQYCLFRYAGDHDGMHGLLRILIDNNIPVYHFSEEKLNMHDAYLQTVAGLDSDAKNTYGIDH